MISTADLQDWMKADDADAPMLRILEEAAVKAAERITGRYLGVAAAITEIIPFKSWPISLANEPVAGAITSLSLWDGSTYAVVDAADYYLNGSMIYPNGTGVVVTSEVPRRYKAIYQAGYVVDAGDAAVWAAPADIRMAVMLLVGHWFENRESVIVGTSAVEVPMTVQVLLSNYTRVTV